MKTTGLQMVGVLVWVALISVSIIPASGQQVIALYEGNIPNAKTAPENVQESFSSGMYRNVTAPSVELYLPEKNNASGAAVLICPGGGYSVIVYNGEGVSAAKEMAKNGVAAFVLKYRLPNNLLQNDKKIAPLQDAQQALKLVRKNATAWGIDTSRIGIMGFSAGGHLASTVATHFNKDWTGLAEGISIKPAFQILVYPVISMQDSLTHQDSRRQLMGEQPSKKEVDELSNELQVNEQSPPAYITHAADDNLVDVDNSIAYFEQLRRHKVPVEMHIYPKGGHGFIFRQKGWMDPLFSWMKSMKWIK